MKITSEPRSDQWNADDFVQGPRVFTIEGVRAGKAEAKYDIDLVEGGGRCWRPPPTVLRLLAFAWDTDESDDWIGRQVELYRDANVRFGGDKPGGVRVSAISHITKPHSVLLTTTRGKRGLFTVKPLAAPVQDVVRDWHTEIDATTTTAALTALYQQIRQIPGAYTDELKTAFTDRGAALKVTAAPEQTEGDAA